MKNLAILFVGLFLFSCSLFESPESPVGEITILPKTMAIVNADNQLGFEIFNYLSDELNPNENIFISPMSINFCLGMARNGAKNNTLEEMEAAMHLSGMTHQEINETFKSIHDDLINLDNEVTLTIANSVWYDINFQVVQSFLDDNQDYFNAEVQALDFGSSNAVSTINDWVADNTEDKIDHIIDVLSPYDRMVLINAIYFNGMWKYQFNVDDTYSGVFHLEDNSTVSCEYMTMEADLEIMANSVTNGVKLPYGNELYNYYALVPQDNVSINELIDSLDTNSWGNWRTSFYMHEGLNIHFPKYTFEYEKSLNNVMQSLGMEEAFTEQADFSGITSSENIFISEILHKSFVEVDEEGTEAAAVTAIVFETTSANNNFMVNKAFVFLIEEKQTGAIVFIGKLGQP